MDLFNISTEGFAQPQNETPQIQPGKLTTISTIQRMPPTKAGNITMVVDPDTSKRVFFCNIFSAILTIDPYMELIETLINATEQDVIILNITSPGGNVDVGIQIIHHISNTKAKVVGIGIGLVASIAAVIWSTCHVRKVTPNAILMYHMPSGVNWGKTADIAEQTQNIQLYFKNLLCMMTRGILNDEDLENIVINRKDIYLPAEIVNARLRTIGQQKENK